MGLCLCSSGAVHVPVHTLLECPLSVGFVSVQNTVYLSKLHMPWDCVHHICVYKLFMNRLKYKLLLPLSDK